MWQHISNSHRITTKVVVADKCLLAAFKAALVFIPIIVMLIITSLNLFSVALVAADSAADLRCSIKCAIFDRNFAQKQYGASIRRSHATNGYRTPHYLTSWEHVHRC
jgi:hypothetical protein